MTSTEPPLLIYTLRLADNALILGHRLSEWCGRAPALEEDLALANMALDLIGQARLLYAYAGEVEGKERDEDRLAYLRRENEYRNVLLVEQPNGDFAVTIVRQLLYAAYAQPYFAALAHSKDAVLAGIAGKAAKELVYHVRHCGEWTIRLGDGTAESHRRAQAALEELWPFTGEMFEVDELEQTLIDAAVAADPRTVRPQWERTVDPVFAEAMLRVPDAAWMQSGGRRGHHTEHLGYILAELQYLQRAYPGATW